MTTLYMISDLNTFLETLDERYTRKVSKSGGTVARKVREVGEPASSVIPIGAPQWMVCGYLIVWGKCDYTCPHFPNPFG